MRRVSESEYEGMVRDGEVLARNDDGGITVRCADGTYLKVFRRPRVFSSARLRPLSRRFVSAAERLKRFGIASVEVLECIRVPHLRMDAVRYRGLPGASLSARLNDAAADPVTRAAWLQEFARFIARLHANGVYFRGLRFDNVIANEEWFGLIDVAAARFRRGRLSPRLRARNVHHFLRYEADRAIVQEIGAAVFLRWYLEAAFLPRGDAQRFLRRLRRSEPAMADDVDMVLGEQT